MVCIRIKWDAAIPQRLLITFCLLWISNGLHKNDTNTIGPLSNVKASFCFPMVFVLLTFINSKKFEKLCMALVFDDSVRPKNKAFLLIEQIVQCYAIGSVYIHTYNNRIGYSIQDNIYVETSLLSIFYWLIQMRWMYGIIINYISGQSEIYTTM